MKTKLCIRLGKPDRFALDNSVELKESVAKINALLDSPVNGEIIDGPLFNSFVDAHHCLKEAKKNGLQYSFGNIPTVLSTTEYLESAQDHIPYWKNFEEVFYISYLERNIQTFLELNKINYDCKTKLERHNPDNIFRAKHYRFRGDHYAKFFRLALYRALGIDDKFKPLSAYDNQCVFPFDRYLHDNYLMKYGFENLFESIGNSEQLVGAPNVCINYGDDPALYQSLEFTMRSIDTANGDSTHIASTSLSFGSTYKLVKELMQIAPLLGINLENGIVSDSDIQAINRFPLDGSSIYASCTGVERCVWLAVYEAARLSIANKTVMGFTWEA